MDEPFVGRTAELAELDRQLELAEGGHGRAALLVGPAGIGKTAPIRRCLAAWAARTDAVLACGDPEEANLCGGLLGQLAQPAAGAAAGIAQVLAFGGADPLTAGAPPGPALRRGARPQAVSICRPDTWGRGWMSSIRRPEITTAVGGSA